MKVTQRAHAEVTLTHGLKYLMEAQQSIKANDAGGFYRIHENRNNSVRSKVMMQQQWLLRSSEKK